MTSKDPFFRLSADSTVFDHTSIAKTVLESFGLDVGALTPRVAAANSLLPLVRDTARQDVPKSPDLPPHQTVEESLHAMWIDDFRVGMTLFPFGRAFQKAAANLAKRGL